MADVFLSYARDDVGTAKLVANALSASGWTVWWDRTIPPGRTFDDVLEEALDRARCVVVLWSKKSVTSHWVKAEAGEGARREILVPVFLEAVKIPLEFRRVQAADLTGWKGEASHPEFEKVLLSIGNLVRSSPLPPTPSRGTLYRPSAPVDHFHRAPAPESKLDPLLRSRPHPWRWIAGLLVVIASVGGAYWSGYLRLPQSAALGGATSPPSAAPGATTNPRVFVPSVTGRTLDDAAEKLKLAGLTPGTTTYRESAETEAGLVIAQRPIGGEQANQGASVDLVVARPRIVEPHGPVENGPSRSGKGRPAGTASRGNAANVDVPALVGLTLEQAKDRLARRNLTVGRIEHRVDDDFAPEEVMAQDPAAPARVAPGSAVSLVVAAARSSPRGTAKPSGGDRPEPSGRQSSPGTITNFRAVDRTPAELLAEFDLSYDGTQGTSRVSAQACPTDVEKKRLASLMCERALVSVGANHLALTMALRAPGRAETTGVEICLAAPGYSNCQSFPFTKRWSR
jgi:hypothetical protein